MCMLAPIDSGVAGLAPGVDVVGHLHRGGVEDESAVASDRLFGNPGAHSQLLRLRLLGVRLSVWSSPLLSLPESHGHGDPDRHEHRSRIARGLLQWLGRSTGRDGTGREGMPAVAQATRREDPNRSRYRVVLY